MKDNKSEDDVLARENKDHSALIGAGALGGGALLASNAAPLVTGRTRLYHGTTPQLAQEVRRTGIKPSADVSSPSLTKKTLAPDIRDAASKLVYMADTPTEARTYAGQAEFLAAGGDPRLDFLGRREEAGLKAAVNPFHKGVVEADMPLWHPDVKTTLRQNPEARGSLQEFANHLSPSGYAPVISPEVENMRAVFLKNKAFAGGIDTKWIRGSKDFQRLSLDELKQYAATHPGRFGAGLGLGALGIAGMGYGAHKLYNHFNQPRVEKTAAFRYGEKIALNNGRAKFLPCR